jgi:hypothetical protein
MRKQRRRFWFWLSPDDPLVHTLDTLGPHMRNAWIVMILRAALSPGGFRDLVAMTERLASGQSASPVSTPPPADTKAVLDQAMAQFGWPDDGSED